jgi:hypothetical protein
MQRDTVSPVVEAAVAAVEAMPGEEVILVANGPAEGRRRLEFRSPAPIALGAAEPSPA